MASPSISPPAAPALPPTTYAPDLSTRSPYAVQYQAGGAGGLRYFASDEARQMWLQENAGRVLVLAILNRIDPRELRVGFRSRVMPPDSFRQEVALERKRPGMTARFRSIALSQFRETGDLSFLADAARHAAVESAANRTEG